MAAYLKLHPAVDGLDGLHWHEVWLPSQCMPAAMGACRWLVDPHVWLPTACRTHGPTLCPLLFPAFTCVRTSPPVPVPQTLTKESHFFSGALGRASTSSRAAYRSYFPTVLRRWWVEAVKRCGKVGAAAGCALVLMYCCAT